LSLTLAFASLQWCRGYGALGPPSPDATDAGEITPRPLRPKTDDRAPRKSREPTNRESTAGPLNAACPGKLPGLEAFFAEDGAPLCRFERHGRLLTTGRARGEGFNPLADGTHADRSRRPFAFAALAPLRLVFEVLV